MFAPLHPVRVEKRVKCGRTRFRLHMQGQVPLAHVVEAAESRSGWVDLEKGWIDIFEQRPKRKRTPEPCPKAPPLVQKLMSLGKDRCLFDLTETETGVEVSNVERFRLEAAYRIASLTADFSRRILCTNSPTIPPAESRRRLFVPPRARSGKTPEVQ